MTARRTPPGELDQAIAGLHAAMTGLETALLREAEALAAPGAAALDEVVAEKRRWLDEVATLERRRQLACRDESMPADPGELPAALAARGRRETRERWDGVVELLARCQRQNLTNGAMLQLRRRFAGEALAILRGSSSAERTYSPSGTLATFEARSPGYLTA